MNIYQVLKDDHKAVKALLKELVSLEEKDDKRRHKLVGEIRDALVPHSRAEESVLYNSMRALNEPGKVMHGYKEHMEAETLLRALQVADKIDLGWKATAKKLKEALEHHIKEEEEDIFSQAKELFSDEESEAMAKAFQALKPKIEDENFMQTSVDLMLNLLPPRLVKGLKKAS